LRASQPAAAATAAAHLRNYKYSALQLWRANLYSKREQNLHHNYWARKWASARAGGSARGVSECERVGADQLVSIASIVSGLPAGWLAGDNLLLLAGLHPAPPIDQARAP